MLKSASISVYAAVIMFGDGLLNFGAEMAATAAIIPRRIITRSLCEHYTCGSEL